MKCEVRRYSELSESHLRRWAELQAQVPGLESPYFHPEFTRIVAAVRDDVRVGVIEDGYAFFFFQTAKGKVGHPVGWPLSDYHGLVASSDFSADMKAVVSACGLAAWDFDHVPARQAAFAPWKTNHAESPVIDLSVTPIGSAKLRTDAANRRRKLEREVGPLQLELESSDDAAFGQLLAWKEAQYLETGVGNIFATPWVQSAVSEIRRTKVEGFTGFFSVLRAGGKPVAAHFGMRSRQTLHYWFPAYDAGLSTYSPGILLLLAIAEASAAAGMSRIDLGKGDAFYKQRLANGAVPLWEGSVVASPWLGAWRSGQERLKSVLREGPLEKPAKLIKKWLRQG